MIKKQIEFNNIGVLNIFDYDFETMVITDRWVEVQKGDKLIIGYEFERDGNHFFMLADKGLTYAADSFITITDPPEESEDLPDLSNWGINALPTKEEIAQAWTEGKQEFELSYSERVETRAVALSMKNQLIDLKK